MRAKLGEVLDRVKEFLYCNPSTPKEIGESMGWNIKEAGGRMRIYERYGHFAKQSAGYLGCHETVVYCLPGEESLAEIKFLKLRERYWQEREDRENNLLRTVAENVIIGDADINRLIGYTPKYYQSPEFKLNLKQTYLRRLRFVCNKPGSWRGPAAKIFNYIEGMEKAVGEKIFSWLPEWDKLNSGEKGSVGSFLKELPHDLEKEVRGLIGADAKENRRKFIKKYIQRPEVKERRRKYSEKYRTERRFGSTEIKLTEKGREF